MRAAALQGVYALPEAGPLISDPQTSSGRSPFQASSPLQGSTNIQPWKKYVNRDEKVAPNPTVHLYLLSKSL